ncbi:MAG TPA: lipocalin-like domain-containing protein [Anaerolineae bacterium]|jgi:hypothetical protein
MTPNPFVGTWRLRSVTSRAEDGTLTYPYGPDALGYITYTDDGFMAVSIMSAGRSPYAGDDQMGGTVAEKAASADAYLTYHGRYTVLPDRVIHHSEISLYPNWIGADIVRFYHFDGDILTLTAPLIRMSGTLRTNQIVWERIQR